MVNQEATLCCWQHQGSWKLPVQHTDSWKCLEQRSTWHLLVHRMCRGFACSSWTWTCHPQSQPHTRPFLSAQIQIGSLFSEFFSRQSLEIPSPNNLRRLTGPRYLMHWLRSFNRGHRSRLISLPSPTSSLNTASTRKSDFSNWWNI